MKKSIFSVEILRFLIDTTAKIIFPHFGQPPLFACKSQHSLFYKYMYVVQQTRIFWKSEADLFANNYFRIWDCEEKDP